MVAIIAILAAIAVPNFLEAQTRAKYSRVKSDFRAMQTALESYRVDANHYPPSPWPTACYTTPIGWPNPPSPYSQLCRELTTPNAYITILPKSPFATRDWIADAGKRYYQGHARDNEPGFVILQWVAPTVRSLSPAWENRIWMISDVGPNGIWDNWLRRPEHIRPASVCGQ